jgi:hypothetical protein
MIAISRNTDPMPGRAVMNPSTTRRRRGATEMTRSTRRMRSARSTDMPPPRASAIPTITKSKMFQPDRKNRRPAHKA